ncbi:hypothetical protein SNE25_26285 [Mucilaginibacter sabulilitoris]|uniref:Uncharacterized protein n=1 Tax=Mucilaginibacter sabulilitoris TaxID=1173583 RepID=A0ABZ0TI53_9SPHI|nr:hypothetical protein [Mucilaginibacter sabulilitoris]WPU92837.1 hypothetical protein SNE25_26285 [Mucilaginibacter sabulilitoris]
MIKNVISCFLLLLFQQMLHAQQEYRNKAFSIKIDNKGQVVSIKDASALKDYAVTDKPGFLLQVVEAGKTICPVSADLGKDAITIFFPEGKSAKIRTGLKDSYITFRVTEISKGIDALIWGPLNTTIADTIGNTVGVVRSAGFAVGLQCLNKKTSGGEFVNDEGAVYERGTTAVAKPFGSSLQAFTVNRSHDRNIKVWDRWPDVPLKAISDGGLNGSAIALFGCKPAGVLNAIESIIRQEGLPYSTLKKQWIKKSTGSGQAYMISTFNETNIDTFLTYAKKMGMAGVYEEDPFETWGHFVLKKSLFPNGRAGFKACVDKAHAIGLRLGFHVLSNFITTNDAYINPVPDPRLALAGTDTIMAKITADATEIEVKSDKYFKLRSDLNSVRIGDEIVRFMDVTKSVPYRLTGCTRGAFGTRKTEHLAGEQVSRLIDHPYNVFFPNWELQKEMAANIANFINETGVDQMDFDGHEGTYASGMGDLSFNTFAEDVFKKANHPMVLGSSRANHYFWHINNYLNWGEPWYGAFRESQSDLRIANQKFYEDNYLPNMLGWFLITAQTSPDDIDWMLARAAGFNAGYALVVRQDALANPNMNDIISLINLWTEAQHQGLFNRQQKQWLKDPANEAHLLKDAGKWYMQRFDKFEFIYQAQTLQPGQPTSSAWEFENKQAAQSPQLIIAANGEKGGIKNPVIEIDNAFRLSIPVTLLAGQSLVIFNSNVGVIYDQKGKMIDHVTLDGKIPKLTAGNHKISFDALMDAGLPLKARLTLKLLEGREMLAKSSVAN